MDKIRTLNLDERIDKEANNLYWAEKAIKTTHRTPKYVRYYNEIDEKYFDLTEEHKFIWERKINALNEETEVLRSELAKNIKLVNIKNRQPTPLKVVR